MNFVRVPYLQLAFQHVKELVTRMDMWAHFQCPSFKGTNSGIVGSSCRPGPCIPCFRRVSRIVHARLWPADAIHFFMNGEKSVGLSPQEMDRSLLKTMEIRPDSAAWATTRPVSSVKGSWLTGRCAGQLYKPHGSFQARRLIRSPIRFSSRNVRLLPGRFAC